VRGGNIIGGGVIKITKGRGANLVLFKRDPDDLYGYLVLCEINIIPLVEVSKLLGRFWVYEGMELPFGFSAQEDFYEEVRWAQGGMHVFTYNFIDNVQEYFGQLLEVACQ